MLDPKLVAENPEIVLDTLRRRNADQETMAIPAKIKELSDRRGELLLVAEAARATRNKLSPQIGAMMKAGDKAGAEELKLQVKKASEDAKRAEVELDEVEQDRTSLLMKLPNLLHEDVPAGATEDDNVEVRQWGSKPEMDFEPIAHDILATNLGILDQEASAKISGARFAVLHRGAARMERALINFFMDTHTDKNGYNEVMVPYVVWRTTMEGTGQLPKFEDDAFKIAGQMNGQDAFLIPTAEVPVTNLLRGEIVKEEELPKAWACFTPCFRSEAGAYGKDTRGLIRQHQFHKVEMVRITTPEKAQEEHELLTSHAEGLLQALGLHYRVVRLCGGDVGFSASLCYDLEVWLPGQSAYREISSCSMFGDFQTRRMSLRYRPESDDGSKKKTRFCHTINGSGLAVGRTLVAILENYQQADGSVLVPKVLQPYMGGLDRIV
jgi:seryl-tRNA synthetase